MTYGGLLYAEGTHAGGAEEGSGPITGADILFHLSTVSGPGLSEPQMDVDTSLGGFISSTIVVSATPENLFDNVSSDENVAEDVEYRCLFVRNSHDSDALSLVRVFISTQISGGATIAIGLDGTGVTEEDSASPQAVTVANESSAPSGVTFSNPTSYGDGLVIGDLGPGEVQAIWIRRTAQDSAAISSDGASVRVSGSLPY